MNSVPPMTSARMTAGILQHTVAWHAEVAVTWLESLKTEIRIGLTGWWPTSRAQGR